MNILKRYFSRQLVAIFYNAVTGFNRLGMDDANHVYDEVFVKIWY